jgi:hypothetical protein
LRPLYISLNEEKSKEEEENQSVEKGHTERKQLGWLSKQKKKRRTCVSVCCVSRNGRRRRRQRVPRSFDVFQCVADKKKGFEESKVKEVGRET